MLGKLIKYEFKATSKLFLLLYIAVIIMAGVNSFYLDRIGDEGTALNIIRTLLLVAYILLAVAMIIVTIVVIVKRFYKNLLGEEGYLMWTLPVTVDQHILSRLIVGFIWMLSSTIVALGSVLILTSRIISIPEYFEKFLNILEEFSKDNAAFIPVIIIFMIFIALFGIMQFYAASSIGMNLTQNRLLGSVLGFIMIYVVNQVISTIVLLVFLGSRNKVWGDDIAAGLFFLTIYTIIYIAFTCGLYLLSRNLLKNRLNLS